MWREEFKTMTRASFEHLRHATAHVLAFAVLSPLQRLCGGDSTSIPVSRGQKSNIQRVKSLAHEVSLLGTHPGCSSSEACALDQETH